MLISNEEKYYLLLCNKVDYLSRNGVVPKIDSSKDDEMVLEYFRQVERVKKIYENS